MVHLEQALVKAIPIILNQVATLRKETAVLPTEHEAVDTKTALLEEEDAVEETVHIPLIPSETHPISKLAYIFYEFTSLFIQ